MSVAKRVNMCPHQIKRGEKKKRKKDTKGFAIKYTICYIRVIKASSLMTGQPKPAG
jgi:hypothetical protein